MVSPCSSGHMAAMPVIRIPLMENLSGTPVTPSQRHSFAVSEHGEIGRSATTALFNSRGGGGGGVVLSPLQSDISKGRKKSDISESQMTFTFTRKYSDIFKAARLKKKELQMFRYSTSTGLFTYGGSRLWGELYSSLHTGTSQRRPGAGKVPNLQAL